MRAFKYLVATPGLGIGGALAVTFVIFPHYIKEFFKNNYYSYRHLGKSLINVGLEEFYFKQGVMADKRTKSEKAVGFLGYLLALVTCGIVPIAHNLLKLGSFTIAVIASPFVGLYKFIAISFYPRFNGQENQSKKIQKMKDLYSALQDGEYNETTQIIINSSGKKGVFDFIRKLFSFNLNTSTEDILAAELKKIQDPNSDLDEAINAIQQKHSGIFFFTQEVRTRRDKETKEIIEKTKETVENYLNGTEEFTYQKPNIKSRKYADLFFYTGEDTSEKNNTIDNPYNLSPSNFRL